MKALNLRYKRYFTDKSFIVSLIFGIVVLIISFVINFYASTYATNSASLPVTDVVLSNIPVYDVDNIFIYGPVILWSFVLLLGFYEPKRFPFGLKTIALFIVIRSVFITLTHIGPFPDQTLLNNPTGWITSFAFGGDLFFSAHTGAPFLMAMMFWDNKLLRWLFTITAVFFGIIVLLGHFHYSIDVLSAFFITYAIYRLAEILFKKELILFYQKND